MRNFSLKLLDSAYVLEPKVEQQLLTLLNLSLVLNLLLPLYLIFTNGIFIGLIVLLLDLVIVFSYALYLWFNRHPGYRIHFTITLEGVRYRSNIVEPEQEFEWAEVDTVQMEEQELVFTLKNGEEHALSLDKVQDEDTLRQAKIKIKKIAKRKDILVL